MEREFECAIVKWGGHCVDGPVLTKLQRPDSLQSILGAPRPSSLHLGKAIQLTA